MARVFSWTAPNLLTISRFALVPVMCTAWFARAPVLAAKAFALAALTDAVDGFVARTWPSQQSAWGAFMDPVADKVLVCCALVLVASARASDPFVGGCAVVLISRELAVSALREYAAGAGQPIPVDWLGKVKTALQCGALALLLSQGQCLAGSAWDSAPLSSRSAVGTLGAVALLGATLVSMVSAWRYVRAVQIWSRKP
jgi:CDP-diacylglycerol--glycerol-3-phosphate 3-phosphatidyltransferase